MSKAKYAGTKFDLPSDKWFWNKCGELDSIVEFQECTHLSFIQSFKNDGNGRSFGDYCEEIAGKYHVKLGVFSVTDYKETLYATYLITSFASFDNFLLRFKEDAKCLGINLKLKEWKLVGKRKVKLPFFEQICNALKSKGIVPHFEKWNKELLKYYKQRRNVVAHHLNKSDYIKSLQNVQKYRNDLLKRYPSITNAIQNTGDLSFDDFILCTANLKNIAHIMSISLENHINWNKVGKRKPSFIDYIEINKIHFDKQKQINIIRKNVEMMFGISLTDKECNAFL